MKSLLLLAILPLVACGDQTTPSEWTNLLEQDSLKHWSGTKASETPKAWILKDGILHLDKKIEGSGSIITKEPYHSFELKFEWKISEGGNSGVKYRTNKGLGLEYQVLDDDRHKDNQKPNHRSASFYDLLAAPDDKPIKPVGEWNSARIVAKGNHLEHWLNGKKVLELEFGSADWKARFEKSKYSKNPDFAAAAGPILLQDHGDDVWFRNILIKKLSD